MESFLPVSEQNAPCPESARPGVILGVDYGTVRIGVAASDPGQQMAFPLAAYRRRSKEADAQWFRQLVREHQPVLLVVGLPVHLDGRESQKSQEARRFGAWLAEVTGVPVVFFDERFTTVEADHVLQQAQLRGRRAKQRRDMLAAQAMLAAYLESDRCRHEPPRGLD